MQRVRVGRGVVVGLAVGTSLVGLGRQPLWFDEVATSRASALPWAGLGRPLSSTDANIGAYCALLHLWQVFGDGPVALRLLSALASVGTIIITERVGRRHIPAADEQPWTNRRLSSMTAPGPPVT